MIGNIPDTITYFNSSPSNDCFRWSDIESSSHKEIETWPTFPASSEITLKSGREWAENRSKVYKGREVVATHDVVEVRVKNSPKYYKIVRLEHRGNGGRAYKVIDSLDREFDLREDVLFDIFTNETIENGYIRAPLIWGRVGSEMKLVRVGSDLHEELIKATERNKITKVNPSDWEIGRIYGTKAGAEMVYLGRINHYDDIGSVDGLKLTSVLNRLLFFETRNNEKVKDFNQINSDTSIGDLQIKKSSTCYDFGRGTIELPENFIDVLRQHKTQLTKDYQISERYSNSFWRWQIPLMTMVEYPKPLKSTKDTLEGFKDYIAKPDMRINIWRNG